MNDLETEISQLQEDNKEEIIKKLINKFFPQLKDKQRKSLCHMFNTYVDHDLAYERDSNFQEGMSALIQESTENIITINRGVTVDLVLEEGIIITLFRDGGESLFICPHKEHYNRTTGNDDFDLEKLTEYYL